MQIEIFKADNALGLQEEINRWLSEKEKSIEIVDMVQSESRNADGSGWSMTLTMLYRTVRKPAGGALEAIRTGFGPKPAPNPAS